MIRILIADDHPIVRQGFVKIIEREKDMVVGGEASNGHEVIERVQSTRYDVLVLDISMPNLNGVEVLKQLRSEGEKIPILILSVYPEEQWGVRVIKAGASGYLTKETAADELITAIRVVATGKRYIGASLAERLANHLGRYFDKAPHETLSDREYTIVRSIALGKAIKEIAGDLGLSTSTVSTYRFRILRKLNMQTNSELTLFAVENNIID